MRRLNRRSAALGITMVVALAACSTPAAATPSTAASANPSGSAAAGKPSTPDEYARYQGDDRQALLEECARKEGQLVWVSELAGGVITAMKDAFAAKYPYITVSESRANGSDFVPRMTEERQAGKYTVDAFEMSSDTQVLLKEIDIHQPYWSPEIAKYPKEVVDATADGLALQVVDRLSFAGFGYNTNLLDESAVPKTYADLLNPGLKGKMVMSGDGSTGAQLFGILIDTQGEDFPQKLKAQQYTIQQVSGRGIVDLMSSGEIAASPTVYRNHVLSDAASGAPVKWVGLSPVSTNAGGASVAKNAPHPCAALLFTDFILGSDGRAVFERFFYGDPAKDYGFELTYPGQGMSAAEYDANIRKWDDAMRANASGS